MVIVQSDSFGAPNSEGEILRILDASNGFDRLLHFKNNEPSNTVAIRVEHSVDQSTWTTAISSFNLAAGGESVKYLPTASYPNFIRIMVSGGSYNAISNALKGLVVTLTRFRASSASWLPGA